MRHRTRGLAAFIALISLSLLQVGAVRASGCALTMGAGGPTDDSSVAVHSHAAPGEEGDSVQGEPTGAQPPAGCPLVPLGQASCSGGMALPGVTELAPEPVLVPAGSTRSSDNAIELLLAVSLLRPPRA